MGQKNWMKFKVWYLEGLCRGMCVCVYELKNGKMVKYFFSGISMY